MKTHVCTFDIFIKAVQIEIKFPCDLAVAFKFDRQETVTPNSFKLENGQATIQSIITLNGAVTFDTVNHRYLEKKGVLTVRVDSNSGKNTAGLLHIDIGRILNDPGSGMNMERSLERCPDKNSKILLDVVARFIQEIEGQEERADIVSFYSSVVKERQGLPTRNYGKSTVQNRGSRTQFTSMERIKDEYTQGGFVVSHVGQTNNNQLRPLYDSGCYLETSRRELSNDNSKSVSNLRMETTQKDRRIARLQIQRNAFHKQTELLKAQVAGLKSKMQLKTHRENELTFQNERLSQKVIGLESNAENVKNSKASLRRLQSISTKYNSEQMAYRSERLDQLEEEFRGLRGSKQEVERALRENKRESRDLQQKLEDLQNSFATLQKRLQLKESFYKEELRKYNQKQIELENIKIQLNNEVYLLKDSLQEAQRKVAAAVRDKERLYGDEKSKFNRKNQEAQVELEAARIDLGSAVQKLLAATQSNQRMEKVLREKEIELVRQQQQVEKYKMSLVQQETSLRRRHQEDLRGQLEVAKQKYRLQQQELQGTILTRNMQMQSLTKIVNSKEGSAKKYQELSAELQRKLKEKELKFTELTQSLEALTRDLERTKANEDKVTAELNSLRQSYNQANLELGRMTAEKKETNDHLSKTKQHQAQLNSELKIMVRNLAEELEIAKDTNAILDQERTQAFDQNQKLNNEVEELNNEIRSINQKEHLLLQESLQAEQREKNLSQTVHALELIISQQKELLDKQDAKFQQLQHRAARLEEQNSQLPNMTEQINRLQKNLRDRDGDLRSKSGNENKLEVQVQKLQYQNQCLQEQIKTRMVEIQKERLMGQAARKDSLVVKDQLQVSRQGEDRAVKQLNRIQLQKLNLASEYRLLQEKVSVQAGNYQQRRKNQLLQLSEFSNSILRIQNSWSGYQQVGDFAKDASHRLQALRGTQQRESSERLQEFRSQICRVQKESNQNMLAKQREMAIKCQIAEEDYNFYRQSVRLKQLQTEEQIAALHRSLDSVVTQLNITIADRDLTSNELRDSLIRVEELSAYLEQKQRELNQCQDDRNLLIEELQQERSDKGLQLRRINDQNANRLESRETSMQSHINQLETEVKQKRRSLESLQSEDRNLIREMDKKNDQIKSGQKALHDLRMEIERTNQDMNNILRRQRQLCEKIRQLQGSVQMAEEKHEQATIFAQLRQREAQDLRCSFEKQREIMARKITNNDSQIRNIESTYENQIYALNSQNSLLKDSLEKSGRHVGHEFKKREELLTQTTEQLNNTRRNLQSIQSQYDEYKRKSSDMARSLNEQLQKNLLSMQSLERRTASASGQIKSLQDKCQALESEKRALLELRDPNANISRLQHENLVRQNARIQELLNTETKRFQFEIHELCRCKGGLLAQIEQLTGYYKQKARQTAEHYDKEIRQLTARIVQINTDTDERIKRAYKEKCEDRSLLEFEIQCLGQELSNYTHVRIQRNPLSRDEYMMEVGDSKMKLFIVEQPLRSIESWIPALINEVRQYQETILAHQRQIKHLQQEMDNQIRINQSQSQTHISHGVRSSFFPLSATNEAFKNAGIDSTSIIRKLTQIQDNTQIALRRVQNLVNELQSMTQDKMLLLTKARETYGGLLRNQTEYVRNQLASMLDYSKVQMGTRQVRVSRGQ